MSGAQCSVVSGPCAPRGGGYGVMEESAGADAPYTADPLPEQADHRGSPRLVQRHPEHGTNCQPPPRWRMASNRLLAPGVVRDSVHLAAVAASVSVAVLFMTGSA